MTACPYRMSRSDRSTRPQTASHLLDVGRSTVRAFPVELVPPALVRVRESDQRPAIELLAGQFGHLWTGPQK
jgi:hypothetical protein